MNTDNSHPSPNTPSAPSAPVSNTFNGPVNFNGPVTFIGQQASPEELPVPSEPQGEEPRLVSRSRLLGAFRLSLAIPQNVDIVRKVISALIGMVS